MSRCKIVIIQLKYLVNEPLCCVIYMCSFGNVTSFFVNRSKSTIIKKVQTSLYFQVYCLHKMNINKYI